MIDEGVKNKQPKGASSVAYARIRSARDLMVRERIALRFSQQHIADCVGCSRSAIVDFEKDGSRTSTWIMLAYAAAVEVECIFLTDDISRPKLEIDTLVVIPEWG